MKRFALFVSLVPLVVHCAQAQFLTGPVSNPNNGHAYFLTVPLSWNAAETLAVGIGGHLVTINDAVENTWVTGQFSNFGGVARPLWIGLNDAAQEGTFIWASGEPVNYLNWSPVEPNDGGGVFPTEDHVHIWNPDSGWPLNSWNDAQEFLTYNAVVEVVPEPNVLQVLVVAGIVSLGLRLWNRHRRLAT